MRSTYYYVGEINEMCKGKTVVLKSGDQWTYSLISLYILSILVGHGISQWIFYEPQPNTYTEESS